MTRRRICVVPLLRQKFRQICRISPICIRCRVRCRRKISIRPPYRLTSLSMMPAAENSSSPSLLSYFFYSAISTFLDLSNLSSVYLFLPFLRTALYERRVILDSHFRSHIFISYLLSFQTELIPRLLRP